MGGGGSGSALGSSPRSTTDYECLISSKVMVHEICHLFCLQHCVYFSCSMNGSNHLEESNNRPMFMCPVCLHKLKSWLGFDVKQRYQAMLEFCTAIQDENFEGSCLWLEKTIEKLS